MKRKGELTARCIRTRLNRPDGVDGKRMRMDRESLARLLGKPISSCLTCVIIKNDFVIALSAFFNFHSRSECPKQDTKKPHCNDDA
ncbi:hypothetical protein OUZ56_008734 [Daphnia magna]|uniref:Uncharacterized protein n=1 Tax=Daphnia magna TaxID=35525 RepID=A0ABR0ADW2_9CRUS|nr:hypothetical protein OUZ56_008734 [Daphnia magna]